MKKILLILMIFCFAATSYANDRTLYGMHEGKPHIKIYLKEVTSNVNDKYVKVNVFKHVFKDVLRKRLNIKFVPVDSSKKADVIVTAKIEEYSFTKKALPTIIGGTSGLVADLTAPKSAGKLIVDYEIVDPATGKALSFFNNFTTDERRPRKHMEGEKAFQHAARKNINRFIYRAFHEQNRRR